jgi:hypothetical protein
MKWIGGCPSVPCTDDTECEISSHSVDRLGSSLVKVCGGCEFSRQVLRSLGLGGLAGITPALGGDASNPPAVIPLGESSVRSVNSVSGRHNHVILVTCHVDHVTGLRVELT